MKSCGWKNKIQTNKMSDTAWANYDHNLEIDCKQQ